MTTTIRISLASIPVDDQDRALAFYCDKLGFEKAQDIPMGEYRWLTVTSPAGVDGVELALEPNAHPASKAFQKALLADGIPITMLFASDIDAEHKRLTDSGVVFRSAPKDAGGTRIATFEDTCGNLVMLAEAAG